MVYGKVELFWGTSDIYSQFHPSTFTLNGIEYNCCEQYMMHQKAIVFNDEEIASQILQETNPKVIKSLGRRVRNFDDNVWIEKCRDVIFEGNLAKFSQNEEFKRTLLATGTCLIAEASPYDRRYGIGLGQNDRRAQDPKQWRGSNWLGEALMKVREELSKECKEDEKG